MTYANNHLPADNRLNTKPFEVHLIRDKMVITIKVRSKIKILLSISPIIEHFF